jgi:monofunctional biosynthetic peptidoglycan transglycosylase
MGLNSRQAQPLPEGPIRVKASLWGRRFANEAGGCLLRFALKWMFRTAVALGCLLAVLLVLYRFVPPVSTLMLARWATGRHVERTWVSLDRISANLPAAVILSEDGGFCRNSGVDWGALHEAMTERRAQPRGASTLHMQTAKNLFLWPSRWVIRKAIEIPLALLLNSVWPKRRVIEIYLNVAEWGEGMFGAEAAARHYFKKSASELTPREAALLAAALPNPLHRNPAAPSAMQSHIAAIIMARGRARGDALDCLR